MQIRKNGLKDSILNPATYLTSILTNFQPEQVYQQVSNLITQCPDHLFVSHLKQLAQILLHYFKKHQNCSNPQLKLFQAQIIHILSFKKSELSFNHQILDFLLRKAPKIGNVQLDDIPDTDPIRFQQGIQYYLTKNCNQQYNLSYYQSVQNTNQIIRKIFDQSLHIKNPVCLGCTSFYQDCQIQQTGQSYFLVSYANNPVLNEEIRKTACALLNNGGGYIIVNNSNQNQIRGIEHMQHSKQQFYNIFQSAKQCLKPSNYALTVHFQQVNQNIFTNSNPHSFTLTKNHKYIVKIKIFPTIFTTFYLQTKVKSNKFIQTFYIEQRRKITQIKQENISKLVYSTYKFRKKGLGQRVCPTCLPTKDTGLQNTLDSILGQTEQQNDQPYLKYKNSTLLTISSPKYEQKLIEDIQTNLKSKKIIYTLTKPFKKYTKNSLRQIYFISHICQFEQLNKQIRSVDPEQKCRCIIATKCIKVRLCNKTSTNDVNRMAIAVKQVFGAQAEPQMIESVEEQGYGHGHGMGNGKGKNSDVCRFYRFRTVGEAVFGYLFLDGLSIKCQLVKEYYANIQFMTKKMPYTIQY